MRIMVIIDHLAFSDKAFSLILEASKRARVFPNEVSICSINLSNKVIHPECAVFNPSEVSCFYDGLMVSTSIESATLASKAKNNSKHVLFLWDIDFLFQVYDYNIVYDLLNSQKVFVKSEEHKSILNSLFNVNAEVCEKFDLEVIWNSQ